MGSSPPKPIVLFPFVTVGLMVAVVLADLALAENFPPIEINSPQLMRHWVYLSPLQVWAGGYWALLTAPLAHATYLSGWAQFSHLLLDMMGLWVLGRRVEVVLGHSMFFGLVFFSAIISTAMSILVGEPLLSQGMTPIGCAFIGLMLATRKRVPSFDEAFKNPGFAQFVGFWAVLVLAASQLHLTYRGLDVKIIPASNASNLGGWLFGFFAGKAIFDLSPRVASHAVMLLLMCGTIIAPVWTPWLPEWHLWRATREAQAGNYVEAMQIVDSLLVDNDDATTQNAAAWLLATARDERVRDGKRAEELALEACEKSKWQDAAIIDTLAAAYAEQENWQKAIETQEKAVLLVEGKGKGEYAAIFRTNLDKFKRREKIRE